MEFTVKLDRYEGPYTKLLELIEQKKLSITEISLVAVADDYISYIKALDNKNIVDISQFIVVASTLVLMKAKSLLPGIVYTEEEEKQVNDLEGKLELYALLMKSSGLFKSIYAKNVLYERERIKYSGTALYIPDKRVTANFLHSIAYLTLATFEAPKTLVKVAVENALRIENVIEKLVDRVTKMQVVTLQSMADGVTNIEDRKKALIINFLALLELLRAGTLQAEQATDGGDITIIKEPTFQSVVH